MVSTLHKIWAVLQWQDKDGTPLWLAVGFLILLLGFVVNLAIHEYHERHGG